VSDGYAVDLANDLDVAGEDALYRSYRRFWHPVAFAADVVDAPLAVTLLDERLVLTRFPDAGVRAFADICPHRGAALSLGVLDDGCLQCPYHGWRFDDAGACRRIPATMGARIPSRAQLRPYHVTEACGLVWVCLDDEPAFPVPEFPELDDPAYHVVAVPSYDWRCGAARRVENFVDLSHIPWVHDGVLGSSAQPEVPDHTVERAGHFLRMHASFGEILNMKTGYVDGADEGLVTTHDWHLYMPLTVWWRQQLPDGKRFGLFITSSPISKKLTRTFSFNTRDFAHEEDDASFVQFQLDIAEADRAIAESQRPEELPADLTAELHIRGADQMSVEYRRWLVELKTNTHDARTQGSDT
jgi:phenylpropionate dioxygenase-like ring-hydroxylating dioxygenase large terminal subunit